MEEKEMQNTKADVRVAMAAMIADFEKKNGKIEYVPTIKIPVSRKAQ